MNHKFPLPRLALALAGLFAAASLAHAHSVWIEPTPEKKLVVRFGEPGEEFEKSPGHLDSLSLPSAWTFAADAKVAPFVVEKKSDHFLFVAADPEQPTFGETVFPVMKRGDKPASWPHFYVRWHPTGAPTPTGPTLTLDVVPTATPGEFRVYLRGQPLPSATVAVEHLGGGAGANLTADTNGLIHYTTNKPGLVLITCNHKETTPGFAAGIAYDVASHNTALTYLQP